MRTIWGWIRKRYCIWRRDRVVKRLVNDGVDGNELLDHPQVSRWQREVCPFEIPEPELSLDMLIEQLKAIRKEHGNLRVACETEIYDEENDYGEYEVWRPRVLKVWPVTHHWADCVSYKRMKSTDNTMPIVVFK